jgi:hypothetical protein
MNPACRDRSLHRLARLIRDGFFHEAEALAGTLDRRRNSTQARPCADPGEVVLFWFEPRSDQAHNGKLRKWVGAINRLMRKIVDGDPQEVARVAAIMKKYAHRYTPLLIARAIPSARFQGATCELTPSGRAADGSESMRRESDAFNSNREEGRWWSESAFGGREAWKMSHSSGWPTPWRRRPSTEGSGWTG